MAVKGRTTRQVEAAGRQRRNWWVLVLAGVLVFILVILLQLPASLVLGFVGGRLPAGSSAGAASGTMWAGAIEGLTVRGSRVERIEWDISPWRALGGQLVGTVRASATGEARLQAVLDVGLGGSGELREVQGNWPLLPLQAGSAHPWRGTAALDLSRVVLVDARPTEAEGTIDLLGLQAPNVPQPLGSYRLEWDAGGSRQGRIRDLDGMLTVRAALTLLPQGAYRVEGEVAPQPGAPPDLVASLAFLGPPDALGRRPFMVEGHR